ncbi:MAG: tripartite tricarboxylate transporter TctB family protein [Rhizobiaceae bacterium]|nr:tripartite tricarboxylate transporter TctB family protein [Rhizobiaceae bacterium]
MQNTERTDFSLWRRIVGGPALAAFGAAMLAISWSYPSGSVVQMGPGYMPHLVSGTLMFFGLTILVSDLRTTDSFETEQPQWRALILISAAVIIFVALIEPAGLVPAMFCAVAISKLANKQSGPLSIVIYSAAVTLAGWLLFIVALGLPLSVFGR